MNKELGITDASASVVIGKGYTDRDSFKLDCFNKKSGNLMLSATFKDSSLAVLNGSFTTYYAGMDIEMEGNYKEGDMHGVWQRWSDKGMKLDSTIYSYGKKILIANFDYYDNKSLHSYSVTDSLNDTFIEKYYHDTTAKLDFEVNFVGQKGLLRSYESDGIKTDSVFSREFNEASYPGGERGWLNFLGRNVEIDKFLNGKVPEGNYTVIVKFIVNEDGSVSEIKAEMKPGYGIEDEAIRVIKKSAKWLPANKYGKYIKAYKRQPITFDIQRQEK